MLVDSFKASLVLVLAVLFIGGGNVGVVTAIGVEDSCIVLDFNDMVTGKNKPPDIIDENIECIQNVWCQFRPNLNKLILSGAADTEHVSILYYPVEDGSVGLHYHSKTESVYSKYNNNMITFV